VQPLFFAGTKLPTLHAVAGRNDRRWMQDIVDDCPLTKIEGGLQTLHFADEKAVNWLGTQSIR